LITFYPACRFHFRIPAEATRVPTTARVKLDSPVKGFSVNATLDLLDQIAAKVLQSVFCSFNDKKILVAITRAAQTANELLK